MQHPAFNIQVVSSEWESQRMAKAAQYPLPLSYIALVFLVLSSLCSIVSAHSSSLHIRNIPLFFARGE